MHSVLSNVTAKPKFGPHWVALFDISTM